MLGQSLRHPGFMLCNGCGRPGNDVETPAAAQTHIGNDHLPLNRDGDKPPEHVTGHGKARSESKGHDTVGHLIAELRVSKAQKMIYNQRRFAARLRHRGPSFGSAYSGDHM